jgi:hypothetical protein
MELIISNQLTSEIPGAYQAPELAMSEWCRNTAHSIEKLTIRRLWPMPSTLFLLPLMPKRDHFSRPSLNTGYIFSQNFGYSALPYAQCQQSSQFGFIPHDGTLLAKACGIVCGGLKYDEAVHLWETVIQILVGLCI